MKKIKMNAAKLQLKAEKVIVLQPAQIEGINGGEPYITVNGYKCPSWYCQTSTCASTALGC